MDRRTLPPPADGPERAPPSERPTHPTTRQRRRDERKVWRIGLAVSVLLHLLAFVAWPSGDFEVSPFAAAGPRRGDPTAAAGGAMQALNVQVQSTRPITPPPVPTLDLTPEPVQDVQISDEATNPSDVLGDRPGLPGPGLADGTGQGDGGTAETGLYSRVPPSPRGMIIPPSSDELKGKEVQVWVFVDAQGNVVPDSTRLKPPTEDESFNRRLIDEASEWVFEPAREGGRAVAAWFPYTISM